MIPNGPRQLTRNESYDVAGRIRRSRERFERNGGTYCHCGGLIYPGGMHTCTHGARTITQAEIADFVSRWTAEEAEKGGAK